MNKENILKIADLIEAGCLIDLDVGFNLGNFISKAGNVKDMTGNSCGTVACIAGYAMIQSRKERGITKKSKLLNDNRLSLTAKHDWDFSAAFEEAREYLGLTFEQAVKLFIPSEHFSHLDLKTIRPMQAVSVLRHLAKTGHISWSRVITKNNYYGSDEDYYNNLFG